MLLYSSMGFYLVVCTLMNKSCSIINVGFFLPKKFTNLSNHVKHISFIHLFIHLSTYPSTFISIHSSINPLTHLLCTSIYSSIHPFIRPAPIRWSMHLFTHLSTSTVLHRHQLQILQMKVMSLVGHVKWYNSF